MAELKEVVNRVLVPLQLSLGIFQVMKTTPLWAVIHCTLAYLLHCFYFPYTDYKQLHEFKGRVFKKVISHATTPGDVSKVKKAKDPQKSENPTEITEKSENDEEVSVDYLGKNFVLKRKEGNKMLMKGGSAYYITDKMWETVKYIGKVAPKTVFVKDHKEIWEEVVTGDIMMFEEVLDSVILDNRSVIRLDHDYFLPVNLLLSEDKLLKTLNFMGLILKTETHIYWLIPASLTFISAVMGFSTIVRLFIVDFVNTILCRAVQFLCDLLPLAMRRRAYSWGNWVPNLKPSNDLKSKIVRGSVSALVAAGAKVPSESLADCELLAEGGNIPVLVGGGAKAHLETLADCESLTDLVISAHRDNKLRALFAGGAKAKAQIGPPVDFELLDKFKSWPKVGPFLFKCKPKCNPKCDSVYIEWIFDNVQGQCSLKAGRVASPESLEAHDICIVCDDNDCSPEEDIKLFSLASCCGREEHNESLIADHFDTISVDVECSSTEATKLLKFAFYMAKHKSGSLRSCDPKTNTVYVRRFVESINAYVRSRYPPLYKLHLDDVVVR